MPKDKNLVMAKALSAQKRKQNEKQTSAHDLPSGEKPFTVLDKAAIRRENRAKQQDNIQPAISGITQPKQSRPSVYVPKAYTDFTSAADYVKYLNDNLPQNENGNAVSLAIADARKQYKKNSGYYNTAEEMKAINAQYAPEDAVFSPEQIAVAALGPNYDKEMDALYTQQIQKEEQERHNKKKATYENVRNNTDFASLSAAGRSYDDVDFDAYVDEQMKSRRFTNSSAREIYNILSREFENNIANPAQWAADHAEELLQHDEEGIFLQDDMMKMRGLNNPLYLYMSDDQVATYSYYLATEGKKKAEEYFKVIEKDLRKARNSKQYTTYKEWAADHPGGSFVVAGVNRVGTVAAVPEVLKQSAQNSALLGDGIDRPLDTSVDAFSASRRADALDEGAMSEIESPVGQFAYNVASSIRDNTVAAGAGVLFGPGAASVLLATESAAASMYEAGEQGLSADEAITRGVINGGWEYATEKIAFDELFKIFKKSGGNMTPKDIANILNQSGLEATEEYANSLFSTMSERLLMGSNSSYDQYVRELQAQGMSYEQATMEANKQFYWTQPLQSAAAGLVSGGIMSATGVATSKIYNRTNRQPNAAEAAALSTLTDISERQTAGTSTIADTVAEKVLTGQAPTNSEIRQLYAASGPVRAQFAELTGIEIAEMDQTQLRAALSAAAKSPAITEERISELEESGLMEQAQNSLNNPSAVDAYFDAAMNAPAASRAAMNDAASAIMDPNAEQNAPDLAQSFREGRAAAKTSANTVTVGEGADFSSLDISNKRKSQLSAASAAFGKLGVQADIDVKGNILAQTGAQVYTRIKNSPAVSRALSEYFGGQWNEFSSQEKADHAARFIGEAVRKEAAGEKLNSSEKAVMKAVEGAGRGAQTAKKQEDDINSPRNRLAGAKVDLDYAQMKAKEYGNARYGGTKETRKRFEMWNDEVKRLQKEVAQLEEQVGDTVSEDKDNDVPKFMARKSEVDGSTEGEYNKNNTSEGVNERGERPEDHTRRRETREEFIRRANRSGTRRIEEIGSGTCGSWVAPSGFLSERGRQAEEELTRLRLSHIVYDRSQDLWLHKGKTSVVVQGDSCVLDRKIIALGISEDSDIIEYIGHEALHMWFTGERGKQYSKKVLSKLLQDNAYRELYRHIERTEFKKKYNKKNKTHKRIMAEEIVAYISGYIHAGRSIDGFFENPNEIIAEWEALVKAHTDNGTADENNDIKFSNRRNDAAQRDAEYLAAVEAGDMETAQRMVDEAAKAAGYTIRAYHGTSRADRVGNEFLPERATSGPMQFFTSDPEIAAHYAKDKADTSLAYDEEYSDYYSQFRVTKNGKSVKVQDLWHSMTMREKQRIKEAGSHITWNDDMDEIIWDNNTTRGLGNWDTYTLNEHKGNAIEALIDCWLESGELYGNEGDFLRVLELAGIKDVEYRDPDARYEKVYDTYLKIQDPFDTANVDESFVQEFEKWYDSQPEGAYERVTAYADMWDKNSISAEKFAERMRDDIANGRTHAWTSIPDSMTDFLKSKDYDGIKDLGGKYTGYGHTVWVPFASNQIKSAEAVTYDKDGKVIPLSERFNDSKTDIRFAARGKAKVNPRTENAKSGSIELATNIGTLNVPTVDPLIFTHGDAELTSSYREVERLAKSFNKELVWIAGSSVTLDGKEYSVEGGFYYKGKLYLNIENMTEGYTMLFGHELCHDMVEKDRRNNGGKSTLLKDYYNLRRAWAEKNGTTDAFEARVNDIINNRVFDDADPDAVFEEFMCDDLGTFMMNEDFARFAIAEKRSLWQKITYAIGNFIKRLKGLGAKKGEVRELEQLHAFMLSALDNYRTDAQRNAAAVPRSVADRLSGINEPTAVAPSTLTRGIRRDARLAEQLIKDSQGRYKPREYRNISPAKWQGSTSESDRALAGVTARNAPEVDSYGYRKVSDGQSEYRVYVTNPNSPKLNKQHKDNIKAVRAFAAATGTRVGFTTGKAIMTAKEGNEYLYKYDAINDNGTVYVNLDAADPYTAIVGAHWYNQYAAANPARARTLARTIKRINKLTGGKATAQDMAVKQITSSERSSYALLPRVQMTAEALKMTSADLLATLSRDKSLAKSVANEQPSLIRRALDVTGDMLSRLTGASEERAKKLMQQAEANLLYALNSSAENNTTPEGSKISTAKKKPLPNGMRAMSQEETSSIKQQLQSHLAEVNELAPVADIKSEGRKKMNTSQQVQRLLEYFAEEKIGKTIDRKNYGEILIGVEQIKDGIRYVNTDAEYAAFFAVPYVLKRGIEISGHSDHKGRGYSTVTFAAPVKLNGVVGNLAVVVKQQGKNKYKMHRILMPNGTGFELKENNTEPTTYNINIENGVEGKSIGSVYTLNIPHPSDDVKFSALRNPTRQENRAWLDEYSEQYGAIPEGENVNSRGNQNVPKQIDDDTRTRQTVRTYLEALSTPDAVVGEVEKDIINGRFSYTPVSNVAANQNADRILARGYDEAMAEWQGVVHGDRIADKKSIALGERLIIEAANRGDTAAATRMIAEVAAEATRAGQIVQAISMVKRLSPAGQLLSIQRQVNKLNDELARRGKEVSISEDKLKEFTDIAKQLEKAQQRISELEEMLENGEEHTENGYTEDELADAKEQEQQLKEKLGEAKNDIIKDVAKKVPPSWVDKLNAWRYLAMLGNPRTHIRNLIGNAVFIPTVKLKQAMASGLERVFVKKGNRTQSVVAPKSVREFAARDAAEQLEWLKSGGKYNATDKISEQTKSFSEKNIVGKALNKVSDFNSWALDAEDGIFLKYHYQTALAGYAAANGISAYQFENDEKLLQKARDFAAREAQRATYRDMNAFSDFMTQASRKLRAKQGMGGALAYAAFEGVVPFKKTPCNIVKRSIEYSPIGVMTALSKGARKLANNRKGIANDYTASEFINDLSAGMTGTMIVALGALLSSLGMLRGRNKDKEDEFEKLQGAQEYSLVIGDWSYTIDWMSPVALPLFVGAELHDQVTNTNEELTLKSMLDSLVMIAEPIFNLSMMDGVQSVLQSYSSEGAIVDMFTGAVESFAGQMFPTIGGQIARTIDPKSRNAYYNDKNSGVPNLISQTARSAMSKTPLLQSKLPERIDAWGRNSGEGQGLFERTAENFFSPGYYSKSKTTEVDRVIQQIYKETGDSSILPANAGKYFSYNGENYYMSADEYVTYAKTRGQTAYSIIDDLRQSGKFNKLSADDKAACIDDAYKLATAIAKSGTNSGYSMDDAYKWQREAYESGSYAEAILGRR